MMFTTGRICVKTAGRDAGRHCVVLKDLGEGYVMVDGQTRRKKVNTNHLEPTKKTIDIEEEADTSKVAEGLKKEGFVVKEKGQSKQPAQKPSKQKKEKQKTSKKEQ